MSAAAGRSPEARARAVIDAALAETGWLVQDRDGANLHAGRGVAIREFPLKQGHGFADYLLFVDQQAVGVLEAKPDGHTLSGVEGQGRKYSDGLPRTLNAPIRPLPFVYVSTGTEWRVTDRLDPVPRARAVFRIARPETLAERLTASPLHDWTRGWRPADQVGDRPETAWPSTLRGRLRAMPPLEPAFLFPNQVRAIRNLEQSFADNRPRALIQMATGSGKTLTAITSIYRLIKFANARRVLFLVDRNNLGRQALKEFEAYRTPDDNRKFTELYGVQRLASNTLASSPRVVIGTIQRLYSMLRGEPELDEELEEESLFDGDRALARREPLPVVYDPAIPPEHFDFVFVDECHRSIYTIWRQVLEYFDAFLIGLTATPAKHTFGFFQRNLVMEYDHELAVADGVNVDFDVYRIRTEITEQGSKIDAAPDAMVGYRDRQTRALRWETPDEDIVYGSTELDRKVVAEDQIRLIVRTFKERLFTEIFPGRELVPKTLIFAKDDSHAEDIVRVVREEFGQGDDFCKKITYKVTGTTPEHLIQEFRNDFNPRIVVTVDLIATGTDIRPIEIVMFMRTVKSRVLFEQMKGRGVRVCQPDELKAVTRDAKAKDHFVIVDCVGVTESPLADTSPLDRDKSISLQALLDHVGYGGTDSKLLSSLASRLSRIDKQSTPEDEMRIANAADGVTLKDLAHGIVAALDPDEQRAAARREHGLGDDAEPTEEQLAGVRAKLAQDAVKPLAANPGLRRMLVELRRQQEQVIDELSEDRLIEAGASESAKEKAKSLVQSFEQFLEQNRDEISALEFFFSRPYHQRLRFDELKELARAISAPPRSWTPERLWRAYEVLEKDKVRGAGGGKLLTDVVSLVRFALHQDDELTPYAEQVRARFEGWIAQQENAGRAFTAEQRKWLEMIRDHVATSLEIEMEDFDDVPFVQEGGLGRAVQVFGGDLRTLVAELNEVLVA